MLRGERADPGMVFALGGPGARKFVDGAPRVDDYWLRVWGARGLMYAWERSAAELRHDPVPRVRRAAERAVATLVARDD